MAKDSLSVDAASAFCVVGKTAELCRDSMEC